METTLAFYWILDASQACQRRLLDLIILTLTNPQRIVRQFVMS